MEKNSKILLLAVLIMLLSLVSFNFNREDISGRSVSSSPSVVISPSSLNFKWVRGEFESLPVAITVNGNNIESEFYMYDSNKHRDGSSMRNLCSDSYCNGRNSVTAYLDGDALEAGTYYFGVETRDGAKSFSQPLRITHSG